MLNNTIEWKPVTGYDGLYEVNNLGEIRSLDRYVAQRHQTKQKKEGKTIKQRIVRKYMQVRLWKNGVPKDLKVHRIVAQAFLENPYNLPQVNHLDENPLNNRVENLEWCSPKYNINYGTCIERRSKSHIGKDKRSYKVSQYTENGEFIKKWNSLYEIERETGFTPYKIKKYIKMNCIGYGFLWKITE